MSTVFKFIGTIAGVVAMIPSPIQPIAAAIAVTASVGAQLTAKKPPNYTGSVADIQIGSDMPSPMMIGLDVYSGGHKVHQAGYGPTVNDVPNTYLFMVTVHSVGGPIGSINTHYADFEPISWGAPVGGIRQATGYFSNILFEGHQLGATPEAAALGTPSGWGTPPRWGAAYKISGKAAEAWSLKWDSKTGKFASGPPQLGISGDGVLRYDPREDDTYPGGEGGHRWTSPRGDKAGYDAAAGTWQVTSNPGVHALHYILGSWERDTTDTDSEYRLVFGWGAPWDGIVVEDFVEFANVCDANGWAVRGLIWEPGGPGIKMENLRRIVEAGGAEPCWKGGRIGLKISAPRVPLDTIEMEDIFWDGVEVAAGAGWRDRLNTVIPKCVSPAHKWTPQQSTTRITVSDFVTADGEEKVQEVPFDLVTNFNQAAQLAALRMFDSREQPLRLPVTARLRRYKGGSMLALSAAARARLGVNIENVVVLRVDPDPMAMRWTMTLMTDDPAKHTAALVATGAAPDAVTIPSSEDLDAVLNSARLAGFRAKALTVVDAGGGTATVTFYCPVTAGWTHLEIWSSTTDDFGTAIQTAPAQTITGALGEGASEVVSGLAAGTHYFWIVTFDDDGQLTRTIASVSAAIA